MPEFIKRINCVLSNYKFYHGFIEYYDKNRFSGKVSIFQKPHEFEYQKEFRFYVERTETSPLVSKVGSLHDIAEMFPIEYINDLKLTNN